jgi:hypothetical protein
MRPEHCSIHEGLVIHSKSSPDSNGSKMRGGAGNGEQSPGDLAYQRV